MTHTTKPPHTASDGAPTWTNSLKVQARRDLTALQNVVRRYVPNNYREERTRYTKLMNACKRLERMIDQ